jgi:hypothetical protein
MEMSSQLHTPAALTPGKNPLFPQNRSLGGPRSRCGRGGEEKKIQAPAGNRTPVVQHVA